MILYDARDRDSVLRDLENADEEVRRLAVERIDALENDERLPRLVSCLGDADWRVRKAAVQRVAARADVETSSRSLIGALADGDNPGRRNAAVEALVEIGDRALVPLVGACEHADADVRKFVVDALAGIGCERATPVLVERLADGDANVRAAAADALGAIGGDMARRALRETATDPGQASLVRFSALHALDALEEPLRADELAGVLGDAMLGPAGLALLGRCEDDPGAMDALMKGLASDVRAARESSVRSLLRLSGRLDGGEALSLRERVGELVAAEASIVNACIERLADSDLGTQLAMVQFLGLVRAPEAVLPILAAGRDEALAVVAVQTLAAIGAESVVAIDEAWDELDVDRRCAACEVLSRVDGERAQQRLIRALDESDPSLRAAAARGLALLGVAEALAPLVRCLERAAPEDSFDGDEEQAAIAKAIVALAGPDAEGSGKEIAPRAVALLTASLAEADEEARLPIARVLSAIVRRNDSGLLVMLMKDPSAEVRRSAVEAIERLEPHLTPEPLRLAIVDESSAVRVAAARALGAMRHENVFDDLDRLADDEDPRVRAAAVGALSRRFITGLDPALRSRALAELRRACHDEAPVALTVADVVYEIGGAATSCVEPLLSRPEPELVLGAARCLGAHADDVELDVLVPLVSHDDWSVRAEVIEILGERRFAPAVPAILRRLETEEDAFVRNVTLAALQKLEA